MTEANDFKDDVLIKQAPRSPTDFCQEYVDPRYWNPETPGFEIIDWERWEAQNPSPPKIFNPPQRKNLKGFKSAPLWYTNRSCYFQPFAWMCNSCLTPKTKKERISNGDELFKQLLNSDTTSPHAPTALRDHLLWTDQNIAPETLLALGSWAWRPQTNESRVIGVGTLKYGWTNNPTAFGLLFAKNNGTAFSVVQMSPDGKWILINGINGPGKEGELRSSLWIYVVQEGDVFKTPEGGIIDFVKPGDLCRLTWSNDDPYVCDNSELKYMYFPRRVVSLDEHGDLVKNSPHFDDLLRRATAKQDKCCETCCYTCACCMTPEERFDYTNAFISDTQIFAVAPTPPPVELIDRL